MSRSLSGSDPQAAVPAATVILVRDGSDGLEALLVPRSRRLDFAPGACVFPGGRVDPGDWPSGVGTDEMGAARRAAAREAREETGLALDESALVRFSQWTPPRFATRFAKVEGGLVALYHGDAGSDDVDPARPGPRRRLWMVGPQWRYERTD